MAKRITTHTADDMAVALLACGCRTPITLTSDFLTTRTYQCNIGPHGMQAWVSLLDNDAEGYVVRCLARGCKIRRAYKLSWVLAESFAKSHSRLHVHAVVIEVAGWVGRQIDPVVLDVDLPPF